MPSTADLQRRLEKSREELREKKRTASRVYELDAVRGLEHHIEAIETEMVRSAERDRLQAFRPELCWCLGLGGADPRFSYGGEVPFFEVYCSCQDGKDARQRADMQKEREQERAQQHRVEMFVEESGIPLRFLHVTLDSYPVTEASRPSFERVKYLIQGPPEPASDEAWRRWHDETQSGERSLLLHGPFGTGKTGLAAAALKIKIAENRERGVFVTVPALLDTIRRSYGDDAEPADRKFLDLVKDVGLLVMDDLGAERVTDWVAERLFVIVNHRHDEMRQTIFTSNLSPDQLGAHIGERTMWRIIEMAEIVKIEGPNLRDRATPKAGDS